MCPDCLQLGLQMRQTSSRDNMLRRAPSSIHGHHRRHSASRPYSLLSRPGRRSRNGFPTTNLTSLGSTNPGIPPILTRTVSTNVRHGMHQKSSWTTVVSWFSNTPERGAPASRLLPHPKKIAAKKNLATAVWKATLAADENSREFSQIGLWSTLLISKFQLSAFQLYPNLPFSPRLEPFVFIPVYINSNSKFLAI